MKKTIRFISKNLFSIQCGILCGALWAMAVINITTYLSFFFAIPAAILYAMQKILTEVTESNEILQKILDEATAVNGNTKNEKPEIF